MPEAFHTRSAACVLLDWLARPLPPAVLLSGCALLVAALSVDGSLLHRPLEQQMLDGVERENRAFCAQFGMAVGTRPYERCRAELMRIREEHENRLMDLLQASR